MSNISEYTVVKLLRKHGFILPIESDDLDYFDKKFKKDEIPKLPESLNDAEAILERGYISKTYNKEVNNTTSDDMARAAREGKIVPKSILDKMKEDRNKTRLDD